MAMGPATQRATEQSIPDIVPVVPSTRSANAGSLNAGQADTDAGRLVIASQRLAAITELVAGIQSRSSLGAATQYLADQLREHLACDHVFIGRWRRDGVALNDLISSHAEATACSERQESRSAVQAAMHEVALRGVPAIWPVPSSNSPRHALLAHRHVVSTWHVDAVVTVPWFDAQGTLRAIVMCLGSQAVIQATPTQAFLQASGPSCASALHLVERANRGVIAMLREKLPTTGPEDSRRWIMFGILAAISLLAIPAPYRVRGTLELQPTLRRFVAAPFDGRLAKVFVEPGQIVNAGETLAQLEDQELQWEREETLADLHRAEKERAGHVASLASGKAELAQHEIERLKSHAQLLDFRLQHLAINSPIAGMVVAGDLLRAEGMPVKVGQSMFEVAPLETMIAELSIPEDDLRFVRVDRKVILRLDAFPDTRWSGGISRIHPRATLRDHSNVFIAEMTIPPDGMPLRPGMRGRFQIDAGWHPLGWNLFHRAWSAALRWCGW